MEKEMPGELERALREIEQLRQENARLRKKLGIEVSEPKADYGQSGPASEGFNTRVEELQEASNYGRYDPISAKTPRVSSNFSAQGKTKKYLPLTDEVILSHLTGAKTIGVYPLLKDDTCWFLACDFDKEGWSLDALAFLSICKDYGVPAYL